MAKTVKFTKKQIIIGVVMIVIALILLPILILNIILIAKGSNDSPYPPDIGGIAPMVVSTGSMTGTRQGSFPEGSLIFIHILSPDEVNSLETDDVITYYITNSDGSRSYITHRIVQVNKASDGTVDSFITRGDANSSDDVNPVSPENVVGEYSWHIAGIGAFIEFMQTPVGIIVVVGIPVIAFIAYDVIRITLYNRSVRVQASADRALAEKDEEIARLRALVGEQSPSAEDGKPSENVLEAAKEAPEEKLRDPSKQTEEQPAE